MHPIGHGILSTGIGLAIRARRGRFPWLWWGASSFADVDHYFWYASKEGDWNPRRAWYRSRDEALRAGEGNLPLHRWRVIFLLLALGRKCPLCRSLGWGLMVHRGIDEVWRWWPRLQYRRRRARYVRHWYVVAERAGYRCQSCGAANVVLELHHRLPLEEGGRDHPDNMMALCPSCHARAHGRS